MGIVIGHLLTQCLTEDSNLDRIGITAARSSTMLHILSSLQQQARVTDFHLDLEGEEGLEMTAHPLTRCCRKRRLEQRKILLVQTQRTQLVRRTLYEQAECIRQQELVLEWQRSRNQDDGLLHCVDKATWKHWKHRSQGGRLQQDDANFFTSSLALDIIWAAATTKGKKGSRSLLPGVEIINLMP